MEQIMVCKLIEQNSVKHEFLERFLNEEIVTCHCIAHFCRNNTYNACVLIHIDVPESKRFLEVYGPILGAISLVLCRCL
jgi:hypothetical protein